MKGTLYIADFRSNNNNGICTGHFFSVAENYQQMFKNICHVKIAGGPIYKKHFRESDLLSLPYDCFCGDKKIKNLLRVILNAWALFRKVTKDDIVILQQSVPAMLLFSLLLTYFGFSNVYMIQYSEEPMSRWYFKIMMFLSGSRIKGIICPNSKVGNAYKKNFIVVPDYIYTKNNGVFVPYIEKNTDFCIIGRLNRDKGIIEAINHFRNKEFSLLIAGKPDNEIFEQELLNAAKNTTNIILKLGYVSDDDYKNYLGKSRYCLLNYQGDYANRSSGVVYDTIFSGVPVIGRECSALHFVEETGVGFLFNDISEFDPAQVMNEGLYNEYQKKISSYQKDNFNHRDNLKKFLNI